MAILSFRKPSLLRKGLLKKKRDLECFCLGLVQYLPSTASLYPGARPSRSGPCCARCGTWFCRGPVHSVGHQFIVQEHDRDEQHTRHVEDAKHRRPDGSHHQGFFLHRRSLPAIITTIMHITQSCTEFAGECTPTHCRETGRNICNVVAAADGARSDVLMGFQGKFY